MYTPSGTSKGRLPGPRLPVLLAGDPEVNSLVVWGYRFDKETDVDSPIQASARKHFLSKELAKHEMQYLL
jgi:hypothetical protein